MRRKLFFIIIFNISFSLHSLTVDFYNDGCGWGFIPEWDDYTTYSFHLEQDTSFLNFALNYNSFTFRGNPGDEGVRIDSTEIIANKEIGIFHNYYIDIDIIPGCSISTFNNFLGLSIQTGWHNGVDVTRDVPLKYEEPFFQFKFPINVVFSSYYVNFLDVTLSGGFGLPKEITFSSKINFIIPERIYPLKIGAGFNYGVFETPSKSYNKSMKMQTGVFLFDTINIWPFRSSRIHYFNNSWGTGSFGFSIEKPKQDIDNSIISQFIISGFKQQTYGIKIVKFLSQNLLFENIHLAAIGTTQSGWIDNYSKAPILGRFSNILVGVEPMYQINTRLLRMDLTLNMNIGIEQNNFYTASSYDLYPTESNAHLISEAGCGLRVFFPFKYSRQVGVGINFYRVLNILRFSDNSQYNIYSNTPFRLKFSLAVTGE